MRVSDASRLRAFTGRTVFVSVPLESYITSGRQGTASSKIPATSRETEHRGAYIKVNWSTPARVLKGV